MEHSYIAEQSAEAHVKLKYSSYLDISEGEL